VLTILTSFVEKIINTYFFRAARHFRSNAPSHHDRRRQLR
jgi:hypothetical protein